MTTAHKVYLSLALALLLATWLIIALNYASLPGLVPTHFDLYGRADSWGSKSEFLLTQVVHICVLLLVFLAIRKAPTFHFGLGLSDDKKEARHLVISRMLYRLMPALGLINLGLTLQTIYPQVLCLMWISIVGQVLTLTVILLCVYKIMRYCR